MQSAIAEKHTLELGTHRPCIQSPEKVNLDNSKSKNQSNSIQPLKLGRLQKLNLNSNCNSKHCASEIREKAQKSILKLDLKLFSEFKHR